MSEIHHASNSFGDANAGVQLGQNSGTVNVTYNQPSQADDLHLQRKCHQLLRVTSGSGQGYEWYKDRIEERVEGTCEWFLNHEHYSAWRSRISGPLLVSADPGCGKSVLAKYLVDKKLDGIVCYFFFKDQDQCTEKQMLCALLHQLFSQVPRLAAHAVPAYERNGDKFVGITYLLWEIFNKATQDLDTSIVTLVVDALDECDSIDLQDLIQNVKQCPHVKWLLTSRPYQNVLMEFPGTSVLHIPGVGYSEQISIEVTRVIKHRVHRLSAELVLREELTNFMLERLLAIEHSTYLWVHLVFNHLRQGFKRTISGLKESIDTMPHNVWQAYEKILNRSTDQTMARTILTILLAARQPLTVRELNIAASVLSTKYDELDLEDDEDFVSTLRNCCGLLVSIHQMKVYFLHQTVREFLLVPNNLPQQSGPMWSWRYKISLPYANQLLFQACFKFLDSYDPNTHPNTPTASRYIFNGEEYDSDMSDGVSVDPKLFYHYTIRNPLANAFSKNPFFEYASTYWAEHFKRAGFHAALDPDPVKFAITLCSKAAENDLSWFLHHFKYWHFTAKLQKSTALMVASFMGLIAPVQLLLEIEHPDRIDGGGKTALIYACAQGDLEVAQLLVEHGCSINVVCDDEQTALFESLTSQNSSLTRYLLDNGADITHQDQNGSILHNAIRYARDAGIVEMLLKYGADINSQNSAGDTPLHLAVTHKSYEDVIKLLLEHGADINSQDSNGETPLHLTVTHKSYVDATKLLLEHGADIKSQNWYGKTPLHISVMYENHLAVKLLLEHGADANLQDKRGDAPLHVVAWTFSYKNSAAVTAVVKLLLAHGADVNVESKEGITPTQLAHQCGDGHFFDSIIRDHLSI